MKLVIIFFLFFSLKVQGDLGDGNSPTANSPTGVNGTVNRPSDATLLPPKENAEDLKAKLEGRSYLIPAPFYSPETNVGLNLLLFKVFPYDSEKNTENSSNILAYATYTTKLQFALAITPTYYWDHGKSLFTGEVGFKNWPDEFYGIGNSTPDNYEDFTVQTLYLRPRFYREVLWKWSAGPFYELQDDVLTVLTPGGMLATGTVPGSLGTFQSGLGLGVRWDSRDIPFFPTKGILFEASATQFSSALGGNFDYMRLSFDGHKYISLAPRNIIALEGYLRTTAGTVPFESMSTLGGNQYLRGIYGGRFRDKDLLLAQIEYRFPIYQRLGGAAFGGIGEVTNQVNNFDTNHTQSTTGAGLRYFLDMREQLNVRVDFGMGPGTNGVYVCAGEAL